jgi:glycosyltransferase involved in cell wall biosynthesis
MTRLVVHDFGGYPFIVQLSRELARRGHEVIHLYADGFRTPKGPMSPQQGDAPSLTTQPVTLAEPMARGGVRRVAQERRYRDLLASRIAAARADVVLSANAPIDVQAGALHAAHRSGAAFVAWVQDLHSVAIRRILGRRVAVLGALIGARFTSLERRMLRNSDAVVAISQAFKPVFEDWGVEQARVEVIENWAPLEDRPPKENPWSLEQGLADRQVVLYAGTLALKHDPRMLLVLADELPEATVVAIAEGASTSGLRAAGAKQPNLRVLPFQPYERLPEVLATADVLVAILEPDASAFSAPSKILTYLAAGRPIVAAMDRSNPVAALIESIGAGAVVDPRDMGSFVDTIRGLLHDPIRREAMASAGPRHAEDAFEIGRIADRFEAVLHGAIDRKSHSSR